MRKMTKEMEDFIINSYSNELKSYKFIANELRISEERVKRILAKNNIQINGHRKSRRIYTINENFFEKIDSPEKAYVLGFLYADGNISSNLKSVRFLNQLKDIEILEKIVSLIFVDEFKIKIDKNRNRARFDISSKKMVKDLISLGCTPKKSLTLKFPTLEQVGKEFQSHFLRGYFDGDGCVYLKGTCLNISFAISKPFLEGFSRLLEEIGYSFYLEDRGSIYVVKSIGNVNGLKILNFIYRDFKSIFLNRKLLKIKESIKIIFGKNKRVYNETKSLFREAVNLFEIDDRPRFFDLD